MIDDEEEETSWHAELAKLEDEFHRIESDYKIARVDVERALDAADVDDATDEDRERVHQAQARESELINLLSAATTALNAGKDKFSIQQKLRALRATFDPEAALSTMEIMPFSHYESMFVTCQNEWHLRDVGAFMYFLLQGCDSDGRIDSKSGESSATTFKKLRRAKEKDSYRRFRKMPRLRELCLSFLPS